LEQQKEDKFVMQTMLTNKKTFHSAFFKPILPLVPVPISDEDKKKTKSIQFDLKLRAGTPAGASSYKKHVPVFEEGTPQEWLDLIQDFQEIWKQNTVNGPHDRFATVVAALRGRSNTQFQSALQDLRVNPDAANNELVPLTLEHVQGALEKLSTIVFPFRALETQRSWMNRMMRKPFDLSTCKTASALSRMNKLLPLFPGGSPASKFSEAELVGILEFSLPHEWRAMFNLKGYTPFPS
jgi:hypothetical protein